MGKKIETIDTHRLMVYAEVLTKMGSEIYELGQNITQKFNMNALPEKDKKILLTRLQAEMANVEENRLVVVKEVTRRFKHDLGTKIGPWDLDKLIDKIWNDYPVLSKSPEQIRMEQMKVVEKENMPDKVPVSELTKSKNKT